RAPRGRSPHADGAADPLLRLASARRRPAALARAAHRGDPARGRVRERRDRGSSPARRRGGQGPRRMSAYQAIHVERQDHVATITLNRPEVLNAQNNPMREELVSAFATLKSDEDVRAIVVTGAGERAFSAGADIKEFLETGGPTRYREQRRRLDYRSEMDR